MVAFDTPVTNCLVDIWVEYEVTFVTPVYDVAAAIDTDVSGTSGTVTASVCPFLSGSLWMGALTCASNLTKGPISVVVPGSVGTPVIGYSSGGATRYFSTVYDISNILGKGLLNLYAKIGLTGIAPTTVWDANQGSLNAYMFDSAGALIAAVNSITGTVYTVGAALGSALSSTSSFGYANIAIFMRNMLIQFPTAKYLAVAFNSATNGNIGAGETLVGAKYSL